jgi:hypothetical protein
MNFNVSATIESLSPLGNVYSEVLYLAQFNTKKYSRTKAKKFVKRQMCKIHPTIKNFDLEVEVIPSRYNS